MLLHKSSTLHSDRLLPAYPGPYKVLEQRKNDVICKDLINGAVNPYPVDRLKIFHGSDDDAYKMAMLDADQFVVDRILAYRGDPEQRTSMEFEVRFADGTEKWITWNKDLDTTVQYEDYLRSRPELSPLIYSQKEAASRKVQLNRQPITEVKPGDTVYVDIRCYSAEWYKGLGLTDAEHNTYVVIYRYTKWSNAQHTKLQVTCDILDEQHTVNHDFVIRYGSRKEFLPYMTLIDRAFVIRFPQILQEDRRERLLRTYRSDVVYLGGDF